MPGVAGVPSAEDLAGLPAAELAVRLAEAYRLIAELSGQVERLSARVEELERQARKDSSTSSRPPSSDSPYRKKGDDRSLRERGKRRPGKQPGDPGGTMCLVDDPDESIECPPAACCGCGAGAAVTFLGYCTDRDHDYRIAARADELRAMGEVPYLIPLGGSTPLGAAAYAAAVYELTGQLGVRAGALTGAGLAGGRLACAALAPAMSLAGGLVADCLTVVTSMRSALSQAL
jgi:hypothetical protein